MAERWVGTGPKPQPNNAECEECGGAGFVVTRDKDGRNFARPCGACSGAGSRPRHYDSDLARFCQGTCRAR